MLVIHSCFGAVEEEPFLEGMLLFAALEKLESYFLTSEIRKDCCPNLEEFFSTKPSIVAARPLAGQRFSCFFLDVIIGVDDFSASYTFDQKWRGLPEKLVLQSRMVSLFAAGSSVAALAATYTEIVSFFQGLYTFNWVMPVFMFLLFQIF